MQCLVCHAPFASGTTCPQCGYDASAPGAGETHAILAARETFKAQSTAFEPHKRVTAADRRGPWLALGIGLLLFFFWVRTCASGGHIW
ncbi:MAG: hypothetical protein QM778_20375 [Myxococcales bacterium]